MSRQQVLQRRRKVLLLCYGLGFLLIQMVLAVGLETSWTSVRDPDFDAVQEVVAARCREAPGRPLFLALGSSRTLMALRTARLNHPDDAAAPLVINGAICGSGPMLEQLVLRRLLTAGHNPSVVFLEVMPMSLIARDGVPIEERYKFTGRCTAAELAQLGCYYAQRYRLLLPWCHTRLLPVDRLQAELHNVLGLDVPADQVRRDGGRDPYGWSPCFGRFSPTRIEAQTRAALMQYHGALTQSVPAPGALQAVRDTVRLCRDRNIAIELVVPPEGSPFRSYAPAVAEIQMNVARGLARELDVPLIDARCWIDDDGFWDGHHANLKGADQFTARFAREVLRPHRSRPSTPAPDAVCTTR